jgi:RND family efflux transporter MFP subunit
LAVYARDKIIQFHIFQKVRLQPMMKRLLMNRIAMVVMVCASLSSAGCRSGETQANASRGGGPASLPAKAVKLGDAEARRLVRTVTAPGTLAADEQATLSFKVAGRLNEIKVDLGSFVRKGQIIGQLETTDFRGRVRQAEAGLQQARARLGLPPEGEDDNVRTESTALVREARAVLEEARANRERAVQLVNQGIQSRAELDRVESAYKVADSRFQDAVEEVRNRQAVLLQRRSELSLARQQMAETTLYASFDGAIRERRASIGEYLAAGAPVATVVRVHPLRLRVEVPEREATGIRIGQSVRVMIEGDASVSHAGRIARLSPAFEEQSRTLIIEAEVDNPQGRLRPGSFAKAEIQTTSTSDAVMVPDSAIVTFAGIQKVFMVKDGKAVEKNVVVGKREQNWVAVEGLEAGAKVILSPGNLVAGQPVTLAP